jgi:hypothetical protein
METVFVIKALRKGEWYFLRIDTEDGIHKMDDHIWGQDLYLAIEFKSYTEAETLLNKRIKESFWGGYFAIEKYFVSR